MWRQLALKGVTVARCTVERLIRRMGLRGVMRGKVVRTTLGDTKTLCPWTASIGGSALRGLVFVQSPAQPQAHGHMPVHVLVSIGPPVHPLVARITKSICLLPMQQTVCLNHVVHIAAGASNALHQA